MKVQAFLRSGFLSRYVTLTVVKTGSRKWEIVGIGKHGGRTDTVAVDGQILRPFDTLRDADAVLATLPSEPVWATSDRVPSGYVDFKGSEGREAEVRQAAA